MSGAALPDPARGFGFDLPDWGPYAKYYDGIARILHDPSHGMVELFCVIGHVRGKLIIPDASFDCGYHPWTALDDLSVWSYRYELEWKDRQYADVRFCGAEGDGALLDVRFVNASDRDQEYVCTVFAVHRIRPCVEARFRDGDCWIGAEGYAALEPGGREPDALRLNGGRRGIVVHEACVDGIGLGNRTPEAYSQFGGKDRFPANARFFMEPGTRIVLPAGGAAGRRFAAAHLRYGMKGIRRMTVELSWGSGRTEVALAADQQQSMRLAAVDLGGIAVGSEIVLTVRDADVADERAELVLDGVLFSDERDPGPAVARFVPRTGAPRFDVHRPPGGGGVELRSRSVPGLSVALYSEDERPVPPPPYADATVTHVYHGDLSGDVQRKLANDSLVNWDAFNCVVAGDGSNHYAGYNIAPVVVSAGGARQIAVGLACSQGRDALPIARQRWERRREIIAAAEERAAARSYRVPDGPHRFSQELTMAQLLLNVTYPQYIENGFAIGATPAKRWSDNALWDAGMHAIGLAAYAPRRALEEILAFTTEHQLSAWPVFPIHVLAFAEIHQADPDRGRLAFFYPRLRRLYEELLGRGSDPGYARFASGLLFDKGGGAYGMDDYPAKFAVARYGEETSIAPADTSAYAIRAAKTLRLLARELGEDRDIPGYEADIERLAGALQRYSWDEASGYYSYVRHDAMERVYYDADHNYDMGLDGVAPLAAGICTPPQKERLLGHLLTEGELWSPHGLLAVAADAPYFRRLGYWNGKVWMPYQWIFWKALLGEGEIEGAERIALTALRVWKDAVDATYNCFELFDSVTGMGEGAHQFAGLSSPVVAFHRAHLAPGTVSAGFDTRVSDRRFDGATGEVRFTACTPYRAGPTGILVALRAPGPHAVSIAGLEREMVADRPWIALRVPLDARPTRIAVRPVVKGA